MTWNLFHGRDFPPNRALFTRRSRLWRRSEHDGTHLQLNRSLLSSFAHAIARAEWDVCLLQEAPPRWVGRIAERANARAFRTLTSRNQLRPLSSWLAAFTPDLIGSWEGGSNAILVRAPWRAVPGSSRALLLNPLRERGLGGERRRMSSLQVEPEEGGGSVCVVNLHASAGDRVQAERELLRAAEAAIEWAGEAPLLLGGDLNLRPSSSSALFEQLERRFGLCCPTAADAIDHLLARGLERVKPAAAWPPEARERELPWKGQTRRLRLSDHAPVSATFAVPAPMLYK
jgi:endonuclease/exonuclease/phosphatase family metal-dependent hydrolase